VFFGGKMLGILSLLSAFWFSGYIFRLLDRNNNGGLFLRSYELLGGYALTAFFYLFSLRTTGSMIPGVLLMLPIEAAAIYFVVKRNRQRGITREFTALKLKAEHITLLCFVLGCFFIHYNLIQSDILYKCSIIFDLPKSLSAMTVIANSGDFVVNPWYPGTGFMYNILYYMPIAFAAKYINGNYALLWTVGIIWTVSVSYLSISDLLKEFNLSKAMFVGCFFLFLATLGFKSEIWNTETQLTYFLSVPLHICAIFLSIAGLRYIFGKEEDLLLNTIAASALSAFAACMSYGLAIAFICIYIYMLAYTIVLYTFKDRKFSYNRLLSVTFKILPGLLLFSILILFIMGKDLINGSNYIHFKFMFSFDSAVFKSFFIPLTFTAIGLFAMIKRKLFEPFHIFYFTCFLFICISCALLVIDNTDFRIKRMMLVRFFLIPYAVLGIDYLWKLSQRNWYHMVKKIIAASAVIVWVFLFYSDFSIYLNDAAFERSVESRQLTEFVRKLRDEEQVYMSFLDQATAASFRRPVYMDFSPIREDAYMLADDRVKAAAMFESGQIVGLIDYVISNTNELVKPAVKVVFENLHYRIYKPLNFPYDLAPVEISPFPQNLLVSEDFTGKLSTTSITFKAGETYLIRFAINGSSTVDPTLPGSAWFGMDGAGIVLSSTGNGAFNLSAEKYFRYKSDQTVRFAYGIGGLGKAKGVVILDNFEIYKVLEYFP
jgi:hypothetical protein